MQQRSFSKDENHRFDRRRHDGHSADAACRANGNRIRVVGTPLDREIIEHAKKTHRQKTMDRKLPDENEYYQIEALDEALEGADFVISGVSSFGVDWLLNEALPHVPQDTPILSVTKGLVDDAEGRLETIPAYLERKHWPSA